MTQSATWPIRLRSAANLREHWATKARRVKKERGAALMLARSTLVRPQLPCIVTITRIAPRALDDDNATACGKSVRDAIAEFLGVDDRDPRVTWQVKQERGRVREYAVRVEIRAVEQTCCECGARACCEEPSAWFWCRSHMPPGAKTWAEEEAARVAEFDEALG
jgi:hypothetical protein